MAISIPISHRVRVRVKKSETKEATSWWVENQLKAALLTDLRPMIPENYFELEENQLKLNESLDSFGNLTKELSWGYAAGKLGHSIYFKNKIIISPRQLSAADVLMNLGMLVSARASQKACSNLKFQADAIEVSDGNAGNVSLQLKEEQIPQLEKNVRGALIQYFRHLSKDEAAPYLSLLNEKDLIELGLKHSWREKISLNFSENLWKIITAVTIAISVAVLLSWLGIKKE